MFLAMLDLEDYRNPKLAAPIIPHVVDEPVTTSNSSGAVGTESSSQPTVEVETSTETVDQVLTHEASPEQSVDIPLETTPAPVQEPPHEPLHEPTQEDTLAIVLTIDPLTP